MKDVGMAANILSETDKKLTFLEKKLHGLFTNKNFGKVL